MLSQLFIKVTVHAWEGEHVKEEGVVDGFEK